MTKKLVVSAGLLAKSQVAAFTRKDGVMVQAHDNGKQAAAPKPAAKAKSGSWDYDGHPNIVGKAHKLDYGDDAKSAKAMHFAGKQYFASGKTGNSFHDNTPVRHFKEATDSGDDDGDHVWMDHSGRVHADAKSDVPRLRAAHEAHAAKSAPKPARMNMHTLAEGHHLHDNTGKKVDVVDSIEHHPSGGWNVQTKGGHTLRVDSKTGRNAKGWTNKAPDGDKPAPKLAVRASVAKKAAAAPTHTPDPHHSDLEEGDELLDEKGQKHEYSATHRGIGRMQVEMRSGHKVPTGSDGKLEGWKKTGRNNITGAGHKPL